MMNVAAIEAIQAITGIQNAESSSNAAAPAGFAEVFATQMQSVNGEVAKAEAVLQSLAAGENIPLHDVMITLEQARIGVQTIIQIRNRMVEAYQELSRMQI